MEHLYQQIWIDLSREVRTHLIKVFGLVRTGVAEIRDKTVISDGYTNKDLEAITLEAMAKYTETTGSFSQLWENTLAKVNLELHPELKPEPQPEPSVGILSPSETEQFKKEYEERKEPAVIPNTSIPGQVIDEIKKSFCDKCTSKGIRHKNGCPNKTF